MLYTKLQYLENKSNLVTPPIGQPQAQPPAPTLTSEQLTSLASKGFSRGASDSKVVIIEFADYQCPFCARYFSQVEQPLLKDYVNSGKARFVFRDYAFLGPESLWAAQAARCAGDQGKFWEYHDYLFNHQGQENSGAFSKENLKSFARTLRLNQAQFNSCLDSEKYKNEVNKDLQDGQTVGVTSTPATFINTKFMAVFNNNTNRWESVGAAPYSVFQSALEEALK